MSGFCNARVWGGGHESCCRTKTDADLCPSHQKAFEEDTLYLGLITEDERPTIWGMVGETKVGLPKSLEGRRGKTIKWKNPEVEDWESAREEKKITKKTKNTKKSKKKSGNHIQDLKDEITNLTESLKRAHESLALAMKEQDEKVKGFIDKKANQLTKAELKILMEGMESEEEEEKVDPVVVKKVSDMVSEIEASAPVDDGEATLAFESEEESSESSGTSEEELSTEKLMELIAIKEKEAKEAKEEEEEKPKDWEVSCIDFIGNQEEDPEEEHFTFRTGPKGNERMGDEYQIDKDDMRATRMSDFESLWHLDKEARKLVAEDSDDEDEE